MAALTEAGGDRLICADDKCRSGDALNSSPLSQGNPITTEPPARALYSVAQPKDSMREALNSIVRSGAADQMRGYANQAMGKTKLTLGLATRSSNLTLSGLAQIVVGEFQKSIGEAKVAEDEKDIFP
ncbi:MAG: CsbD family protein [Methylocystis sp.]|nr:CsbD family protein [Methylocystis sp.]